MFISNIFLKTRVKAIATRVELWSEFENIMSCRILWRYCVNTGLKKKSWGNLFLCKPSAIGQRLGLSHPHRHNWSVSQLGNEVPDLVGAHWGLWFWDKSRTTHYFVCNHAVSVRIAVSTSLLGACVNRKRSVVAENLQPSLFSIMYLVVYIWYTDTNNDVLN